MGSLVVLYTDYGGVGVQTAVALRSEPNKYRQCFQKLHHSGNEYCNAGFKSLIRIHGFPNLF